MEGLDLNSVLNRMEIKNKIAAILNTFDKNRNDLLIKRGIYLYGNPGIGKTTFILDLLKELKTRYLL